MTSRSALTPAMLHAASFAYLTPFPTSRPSLPSPSLAQVRLYYGVRSPAHLAFASAIPAWEAAGVKVHTVFSEQGQGYVQDAFAKVGLLHVDDVIRCPSN